jgi:hypothetical protein
MQQMCSFDVFLEVGSKKTFAGAIDWPGWCRSGRDQAQALQALLDYGSRYATVLQNSTVAFVAPDDIDAFVVTERHDGDATTNFGASAATLDADNRPFDLAEHEHSRAILQASWQAFDAAISRATGKLLRKGPRGGGRDLDKIIEHVLEADRSYLARQAWRFKRNKDADSADELARMREAILGALGVALRGELPEAGPRGGRIWTPRYFVRRVVWHTLDHAWELEDRIE